MGNVSAISKKLNADARRRTWHARSLTSRVSRSRARCARSTATPGAARGSGGGAPRPGASRRDALALGVERVEHPQRGGRRGVAHDPVGRERFGGDRVEKRGARWVYTRGLCNGVPDGATEHKTKRAALESAGFTDGEGL